MDTILILDFGSQTTQLIARRIREIGVYTEIIPGDTFLTITTTETTGNISLPNGSLIAEVKGFVFSGSPFSVYDVNAPAPDRELYSCGLPILGICYGLQRIIRDHDGEVISLKKKEYGRAKVNIIKESPLLKNIPWSFISWMSHGDSITKITSDFTLLAQSENHPAVVADLARQIYGLQFHPEVSHCEYGLQILENFVTGICKAGKGWNMDVFLRKAEEDIKTRVKNRNVLLLISGGVDSTVVAGLLLKCLNAEQVYLMYIDTGLMRKGETEEVTSNLYQLGAKNLFIVDASEQFLSALKNIENPEEKRRIIGDLFITIQEEEINKHKITDAFLVQGTLYTDLIESGKGIGQKAHVIKSHHNVLSPLVERKRAQGLLIEPVDCLYKDEVRALGRKIGIKEVIIRRQPFPGPGLAVRILGDVTKEKCEVLREADSILISELRRRNLYNDIWQAFCVLLSVRSVGVAGDMRKYGWVLAIRAVISKDGMTADVFPFPMKALLEISSIITNQVHAIGRVVYDVSSKPPSTIEWE
ncbi:MAG: glutamine-hydrolyzing GMP synthase [Spirochaetota bacterium]